MSNHHNSLGELDENGKRVYTVTRKNRHHALAGSQFDRIVIQCEVTEDELDVFRARLAPGGNLDLAEGFRVTKPAPRGGAPGGVAKGGVA